MDIPSIESFLPQKTVEMTDKAQKLVREYCTKTLSRETEKDKNILKINEKFGPDVNNIVVVPVYKEKTEHIKELVDSIRKSEDKSGSRVGVILVVNNNQSVSQDILELNQKVIQQFDNMSDRLVVIDKTNNPFPDNKSGVGPARNIGSAYASWYYSENKRNGIITHTDADCIVDENFFSKQEKIYEDPSVNACTGPTRFRTNESNILLEKSLDLDRMASIYRFVVDKYILSKEKNHDVSRVHTAGSNMSSRVVALASVDGIPELSGAEDVQFGENLSKAGFVISDRGPAVVSEFRESDRTTTGHGLGVTKILDRLETGEGNLMVEPICVTRLKEHFKDIYGDRERVSGVEQIQMIINNDTLRADARLIMKQFGVQPGPDEMNSIADFLSKNPPNVVEIKDVIEEVWDSVFNDPSHLNERNVANSLVEKAMKDQFDSSSPEISIIISILNKSDNDQYKSMLKSIGVDREKILRMSEETNGTTLERSKYVYGRLLEDNKFLKDRFNRLKAEIRMGVLYDFLKDELNRK